MPIQRFAASLPGVAGAVRGALKKADQVLGGWLPGGGVASPPTQAIQQLLPSRTVVAKTVRDQVVVPVLDAGIGAGVLPTKEAMFARYLTGTSKPLTVYPERGRKAIVQASDQLAIEQTRGQVDEIYKRENPLYRQFSNASAAFSDLQKKVRDRAETGGGPASWAERTAMADLFKQREELRRQLSLSKFDALSGSVKLSDAERLDVIRRHGLKKQGEAVVGHEAAYGGALPRDVQLSLGSFEVRDGEIRDRYKFDDLEVGRTYPGQGGGLYWDAIGGGRLASDLIEIGLKSGVITPKSGYDIRVPLRSR